VRPALAIAAVAIGLSMLPLTAPASPRAEGSVLTIRLISRLANWSRTDHGPKGPSKGDKLYVRSVLRNAVAQFGKPKGAIVGRDYEVVTYTSAHAAKVTVRVTLPTGTLQAQDRVRASSGPSQTIRVVGGTGRYKGATGTVTTRDLPDGHSASNIYHLRLP
jgi:hypothetical protein